MAVLLQYLPFPRKLDFLELSLAEDVQEVYVMLPGSKVVKLLALNNAICSANILKYFKFE